MSKEKSFEPDYDNFSHKVYLMYGGTHDIYKRMETFVDLRYLKDNESVCYGDGETYHWLLVKKGFAQ